ARSDFRKSFESDARALASRLFPPLPLSPFSLTIVLTDSLLLSSLFVDSVISWTQAPSGFAPSEAGLVFYSPDYEQTLLDQYLPNSPTRSEFLSDDYSSPSASPTDSEMTMTSPSGAVVETAFANGNHYEQSLMDAYLPEWRSEFECMAYGGTEYSDFSVDEAAAAADALNAVDDEALIAVDDVFQDTQEDGADYYDVPYESEELSPSPSPPPMKMPVKRVVVATRRPAAKVVPMGAQHSDVRKRGRPAGSKSDSKMALYAKQYREMKKNETSRLSEEVAQLSHSNDQLRRDNARLSREVETLRKADSITAKISTLLVTLRANPGAFRLCINAEGIPVLEVI
ncbi:hypothetical protein PRIPAC_87812, partial [Pristionchus pacificus]|uniref:Uncharacterized protein n=1 Tax=Pristionchus pacificus TaxID=54126 RepID=A0A2A6CW36_PRIPA